MVVESSRQTASVSPISRDCYIPEINGSKRCLGFLDMWSARLHVKLPDFCPLSYLKTWDKKLARLSRTLVSAK